MIRRMILPTAVALLGGLAGCPETEIRSEEGQWSLSSAFLVTSAHEGFAYGDPVLQGTPLCSTPAFEGEVPEGYDVTDVLSDCVDQSLAGPASFDDSCLMLEEAGEVTWYLDPTDCPLQAAGLELQADRVVFEVADPDGVQAEIQQWVEEYASEALQIEPSVPDDWTNPPGEPFLVMAEQPVTLFLRLRATDSGLPVAWNHSDGGVTAAARSGTFRQTSPATSPAFVGLELDEGAVVDVALDVDGQTWAAGTVEAVDDDAPASLDIVAGYVVSDDEGGIRIPFGARAIVRDEDGRLIYGTPVTWNVAEGALAVDAGSADGESHLPGEDYAALEDTCVEPSDNVGERTVVLEASFGDLTDSLELTWTARTEAPATDEDWEPPDNCQYSGCQCSAGRTSPAAAAPFAALLALAALRIRRR